MALQDSNKVFVFPCVSRGADYESAAKIMSEKNITNIIKSITDKESYIISWDDDVLKCVIKGYYFEIGIARSNSMYAHLIMNGTILNGADDSDKFTGVNIDDNPNNSDLTLCVGGKVPAESLSKFHPKSLSVDITTLDCGELK